MVDGSGRVHHGGWVYEVSLVSWCSRNRAKHTDLTFVCLRFFGPVNPMGSCQARSVYLTTRLLGRLSPLSG